MDNRKSHEATTSFGEVMRNAGVSTQQPYNKRMPEDTRLMILCQGMRIYIPDNFQPDTLLNLCQTLKRLCCGDSCLTQTICSWPVGRQIFASRSMDWSQWFTCSSSLIPIMAVVRLSFVIRKGTASRSSATTPMVSSLLHTIIRIFV